VKHGYVERVGNTYRVTDKVNIPDPQKKLQRRIDLVAGTAKRLGDLNARGSVGRQLSCRATTEQVVFHKPTWPEPSDRPSPRGLRKIGFCGLSLSQDPVRS
jgi:hypothetical protein